MAKRILILLLAALVASAPGSAQTSAGNQEPTSSHVSEVSPAPADTSLEMVRKTRAMLEHYWNAHFEALEWKREFKPSDAWDNAAKAAGFTEHAEFLIQAQSQAKIDPAHFPRLLNELRREMETAYRDRLARRNAQEPEAGTDG